MHPAIENKRMMMEHGRDMELLLSFVQLFPGILTAEEQQIAVQRS